jgi:hypothetical protein
MSREVWQNNRVTRNFPNGGGPFLPPKYIDETVALRLFSWGGKTDFKQFVDALDRELRTVVPEVHERLRKGMQNAVEQGYVPAYVLKRLGPAFTQTAIQAVDQSIMGDDLAAYEHGTDIMIVGTAAYNLLQTVAHEIGGHKVSGGTFVERADSTLDRVRRGFVSDSDQAKTPAPRHYGIDEAVQHHLIVSYLHGQIDTVDPDFRKDTDMYYYEHRKLLAAFIDRSGGIIDLKAITRGSFEDTDETGTVTTDRRTMVVQASTAYGAGAYRKLSILFDSIDFDDLFAEELAERIHPPSLNNDGSIATPGYLDIDNLTSEFDSFDESDI